MNEIIKQNNIKLSDEEKKISDDEINHIIDILNDEKHHYLENKKPSQIRDEIRRILQINNIIPSEKVRETLASNYRYVDDLTELQRGKSVFVYSFKSGKIFYAGIVCCIDAMDRGVLITCKTYGDKILKYYFNDAITFQYLNDSEKIILSTNDFLIGGRGRGASRGK